MKKYQCHKVVEAMKIDMVELHSNGSATLVGHDNELHDVDRDWMKRHSPPRMGGYYVVYEDGYSSWSPAQAFEDGYKLMPEVEAA